MLLGLQMTGPALSLHMGSHSVQIADSELLFGDTL